MAGNDVEEEMIDKWGELRDRVERAYENKYGMTSEKTAHDAFCDVYAWMSELDEDRLSEAEADIASVTKNVPYPESNVGVLAHAIGLIIAHLREAKP
jgi:site-specific DNA-adenine methylase